VKATDGSNSKTHPDAVPLSTEDRAILELESETIAGHTCKVILLGPGAPGLDALLDRVAGRIDAAPGLTRRLGGSAQAPVWVPDEGFDLSNHLVEAEIDDPVDERELPETVARLFAQRLDRERPLWRLDVVPLRDRGAALVWRIHHAVADGATTMRYARALLWDPDPAADAEAPPRGKPHADGAEADDARRRGHLAGVLRREFARSRQRSPFDARIGTRRRIAFAAAPLGELHDTAKRLGRATVNDAVLASVAGGLRSWIEHHHGSLGAVRVKVPVSLHHPGDDAGNRDSFFELGLPLDEPDPVARLEAIHAATSERKAERDAEELDTMVRDLARVSPRLERFCEQLERSPRRFALNVSNVPGPRSPVSVLGTPVRALHSIAEIGERHALRVSVVSCADQLHFGFCADPGVVDDLEVMVTGTEAEAKALIAAAEVSI
jgi:WS/DGAT/MGAT family acyltransferase